MASGGSPPGVPARLDPQPLKTRAFLFSFPRISPIRFNLRSRIYVGIFRRREFTFFFFSWERIGKDRILEKTWFEAFDYYFLVQFDFLKKKIVFLGGKGQGVEEGRFLVVVEHLDAGVGGDFRFFQT